MANNNNKEEMSNADQIKKLREELKALEEIRVLALDPLTVADSIAIREEIVEGKRMPSVGVTVMINKIEFRVDDDTRKLIDDACEKREEKLQDAKYRTKCIASTRNLNLKVFVAKTKKDGTPTALAKWEGKKSSK